MAVAQAIVVDVHGHLLDVAYRADAKLEARLGGNTDFPSMRQGGVTAQLCAMWTPDITLSGPHDHSVKEPLAVLLGVFDYLERELRSSAGASVLLATKATDLKLAAGTRRIALIVGMEGTDALGSDPAVLGRLYARGLRHVGLVHEHANEFGASSQVWENGRMRHYRPGQDQERHLTAAGRVLLDEMKRLGILIDLVHLVEPGFSEVLDYIRTPVLVSHGGARGVADSIRYLSDDQIRAVARWDGVIGASPTPLGPSTEEPGLPLLLDTIDYLVRLVGCRHVGVGTDFKDTHHYYPDNFSTSADTPRLVQGLRDRGYSVCDIELISGGNFMRLFGDVVG